MANDAFPSVERLGVEMVVVEGMEEGIGVYEMCE
jgi:hypothetical protein